MTIPKEVQFVIDELKKAGFEAYVVGGCVRDILRGLEPQDWDATTNANPEEIGKVFSKTYADNKFGTVVVVSGDLEIEVTPYRIESKYTDKRHPDKVKFAKTLKEDLKRRDFTVNAMAATLEGSEFKIIDLFKGQEDLKKKIIRAVGKAEDRFDEDALRMLRAVRIATVIGFSIEPKTKAAIKKNVAWMRFISAERIRGELMKIIASDKAAEGIELLRELGLLKHIIPELEEGYGVGQNKHHTYEVYKHNLLCLEFAAKKGFNKYVKMAALLHDVGKPRVKSGEGADSTFYNHEIVGAKMCRQILNRLKFSKKDVEKITKLVRYHLFYYNVDEVGEASVRRLVRQAGPENMEELLQVRMCDRIGSGCPKAEPYKLRHLKYLIEKVAQDPISVKMLKISGGEVIKILKIKPGPMVGDILSVLLGQVLLEPEKNKKKLLQEEVKRLSKLSEKEVKEEVKEAEEERQKIQTKRDEMTKNKYWVT
ncbi:HD domain-containing protein [Candidatus Parcubacteria bacterium]|nr:HD domain-containing protein [Candidatus Parcubacteria bacterium]